MPGIPLGMNQLDGPPHVQPLQPLGRAPNNMYSQPIAPSQYAAASHLRPRALPPTHPHGPYPAPRNEREEAGLGGGPQPYIDPDAVGLDRVPAAGVSQKALGERAQPAIFAAQSLEPQPVFETAQAHQMARMQKEVPAPA